MNEKEYINTKQDDMELISWPDRMNILSFIFSLVKMLSGAFAQMDIKEIQFSKIGNSLTEICAHVHSDLKLSDKDLRIILNRLSKVENMAEKLSKLDKEFGDLSIDDWIKSGGNIRPNA